MFKLWKLGSGLSKLGQTNAGLNWARPIWSFFYLHDLILSWLEKLYNHGPIHLAASTGSQASEGKSKVSKITISRVSITFSNQSPNLDQNLFGRATMSSPMEVTLQSAASETSAEVCDQPVVAPDSSKAVISPVSIADDKVLVSGKIKNASNYLSIWISSYSLWFGAVEVCLNPSSTARAEDVRRAVERFVLSFSINLVRFTLKICFQMFVGRIRWTFDGDSQFSGLIHNQPNMFSK